MAQATPQPTTLGRWGQMAAQHLKETDPAYHQYLVDNGLLEQRMKARETAALRLFQILLQDGMQSQEAENQAIREEILQFDPSEMEEEPEAVRPTPETAPPSPETTA